MNVTMQQKNKKDKCRNTGNTVSKDYDNHLNNKMYPIWLALAVFWNIDRLRRAFLRSKVTTLCVAKSNIQIFKQE